MMLVKVSQRGQVTIPKSIRQKLGIKPGDNLVILFKKDEIILQPVTETIFDLVGNIPVPAEGPYTIEALREASAQYIAEHVLDTDD